MIALNNSPDPKRPHGWPRVKPEHVAMVEHHPPAKPPERWLPNLRTLLIAMSVAFLVGLILAHVAAIYHVRPLDFLGWPFSGELQREEGGESH